MSWERTTTPPGVIDYLTPATPTTTPPAASDQPTPDDTAPAAAPAPELTATAPASSTPAALTTTPAVPLNRDDTPVALPTMPASFQPAFVDLEGIGPTLQSLTASAADATAKRILQGTVDGVLKSYQVRAGDDDEDLPGIVHPANFHDATNPVVFVQL